jgi:hypothetical protein
VRPRAVSGATIQPVKSPRTPCILWVVKVIVALAAALALAVPAAAHDEAAGSRPAVLKLAAANPVSLRGSKFLAGERVTVSAHSEGRMRSRTVTAGEAGGFLVRFRDLPFDRCEGFLAVARGARGSLARFKLPELMCAPRL